jgi:hypothetical protein
MVNGMPATSAMTTADAIVLRVFTHSMSALKGLPHLVNQLVPAFGCQQ